MALCFTALAVPASAYAAEPRGIERAVLQEINDVRADRGLRRLRMASPLQDASRAYAGWLMRTDRFEHARALPPQVRENLAYGPGEQLSPRGIVRMWLRSAPHRANLLWRSARRAGVGIAGGSFRGYANMRLAVLRLAP